MMFGDTPSATLEKLTERLKLNDDLKFILGRPNFACAGIVACLRNAGVQIENDACVEQAHAIHWMLCKYLEHGDCWKETAEAELKSMAHAKD